MKRRARAARGYLAIVLVLAVTFGIVAYGALSGEAGGEAAPPRGHECFETNVQPGAPAEVLFERRGLQGGGPTWAGVFSVVVRGLGKVGGEVDRPGAGPGFGSVYAIRHHGNPTWFALDEEGDSAIFCAGSAPLLSEMRAEYERLRRDPVALGNVLDRVDPDEAE